MIGRHQLPVVSAISVGGLASAANAGLFGRDSRDALACELRRLYDAHEVILTDSGTSALILALRATVGKGEAIALPAYGCVDLVAAAVFAGVGVLLYDVDPSTLGPDLRSLERALQHGAAGVVVVHLFGYPADMEAVSSLTARYGAHVIEDAAQAIGGELRGTRLGAFGPLTVLSFGRGKGLTGGRGGALLGIGREGADLLTILQDRPRSGAAGMGDLSLAVAQWTLGRPALYWLPKSIPSLRMGETVYRPARAPRPMSLAASALVASGLREVASHTLQRQANAQEHERALVSASNARAVAAIDGATSGYLRFPVLRRPPADAAPELGIYRGYPAPLDQEDAIQPILVRRSVGVSDFPGARQLAEELFTLPTHAYVTRQDLRRMREWLHGSGA